MIAIFDSHDFRPCVALPDIQKSIESARKGMQEDIAAMVKERELKSDTSHPQKNN
jgi:hypothetical protein